MSVPTPTTIAEAAADYHKAYSELLGSQASSTIAGMTVEKFSTGEGAATYVRAGKGAKSVAPQLRSVPR